jgi:hypothetical protein
MHRFASENTADDTEKTDWRRKNANNEEMVSYEKYLKIFFKRRNTDVKMLIANT